MMSFHRSVPGLAPLLTAVLLALTFLSGAVRAEPVRVDTVEVELVAEQTAVVPGQVLRLGLSIRHDPEWHTYWRNPGESGLPTQFPIQAPAGFEVGDVQWPFPTRVLIPPLANFGYEDDVLLMRAVTVPEEVAGETVRFETLAQWLVCREVCVPGEAALTLELPVSASAGPSAEAPLFAAADRRLPAAVAPVPATVRDGALMLRLPAGIVGPAVERLEYFPYTVGATQAAADQRLIALADGGWRLEVDVPPGGDPLATGEAGGVVVVDELRAVAVNPESSPGDPAWGVPGVVRPVRGHVAPFMQARGDPAADLLAAAGSGAGRGADALIAAGRPAAPESGAVGTGGAPATAPAVPVGGGVAGSLAFAVVFALLGGLILNLMPCVFPVIGLKILGFAGHGGVDADGRLTPAQRSAVRSGAAWFAAGVVVSFWALAGLLLGLRAFGESVGWGFQLQSPAFVAAMALLFLVVGLNFSGLFEFGARASRLGGVSAGGAHPRLGAFGTGALAVLVATPCTAPFMGSAIGFTLAQPPASTIAVFTALGIGMALPYILLGVFPAWLGTLPRPGRWMETLKQFLAFPMYAAAAWLAWVLAQQRGGDAVFALLLGAVALACGLWLWGRQVQGSRVAGRFAYGLVAVGFMVGGLVVAWPGDARAPAAGMARAAEGWQPWSSAAVAAARAEGRPVFVDFTAAWCVSCQVNKKVVLESDRVVAAFDALGVVRMRADWTDRDPLITAELARHGRNSVPVYLYFPPDSSAPRMLPELLTVGTVLGVLGTH